VSQVAGTDLEVMNQAEADWFESARDTYLSNTQFTEHTDYADLDRVLVLELMIYRWTQWIVSGKDYGGLIIDDDAEKLRRSIKEYSAELTRLKSSMGLDKASRDATRNLDSPAKYLAELKQRAKMFGVHRETQVIKALSLFNELAAIIGAYDRSDQEEREKLGFESEAEILDWIRTKAIPEFEEIDEKFRLNNQRYWVREL